MKKIKDAVGQSLESGDRIAVVRWEKGTLIFREAMYVGKRDDKFLIWYELTNRPAHISSTKKIIRVSDEAELEQYL